MPRAAHAHGLSEIVINGQLVPAIRVMSGTGRDGLPIGVQLVANWWAEPTLLHLAALLESVRPVRDLHPTI